MWKQLNGGFHLWDDGNRKCQFNWYHWKVWNESLNWVLLLFHCGVCVCVSAGCLMPAQSTVAALMSSARSHGRHCWLRSELTFTPPPPQPGPAWAARDVRLCLWVYIKKKQKKQTYSRENLNLFFQCVHMRRGEEQCLHTAERTLVCWWYPGLRTGSVYLPWRAAPIISKHVKCICEIILFIYWPNGLLE